MIPLRSLQSPKILLQYKNDHGGVGGNQNDGENDGADEGYLNWASSRPPRDDPQMEKPMAMTPFQKPSSLAVMWWSNRKRGNMVTAPCSPAYTVAGEGRSGEKGRWGTEGEEEEKGRDWNKSFRYIVKYTINTSRVIYCTSLTKHYYFSPTVNMRRLLNTHAYSNHSQIRWGCCTKLFSLQDWTTWFSWDDNCRIKYGTPTCGAPRPIPGKCQ